MSEVNREEVRSEMSGAAAGGVGLASAAEGAGGMGVMLRDQIEAALRTVFDPEIPVNIYDLGLVYEIKMEDNGNVKITMTLTAPACPAAGEIVHDVQQKVEEIQGVMDCHVQLTFDPAWSKEMMSEEAKLELGFL
jgi:FeS assembly SUF system protein